MAKKKTKSSASKSKPVGRLALRDDVVQITTRQRPDIIEWLNNTSAEVGLSRDQFIRQIFVGFRESFKAASKPGTSEAALFEQSRQDIKAVLEDVLREQLAASLPHARIRRTMGGGK